MSALKGKRAIITGANQGLGLAIAQAFAVAGADILIGARDNALLQVEAAKLRRPGQEVLAQAVDIADNASAQAFVGLARERWGALDILVNNAGVHGPKGLLDEIDWAEWSAAVQVNLLGTVNMCRLALPLLRKSPRGKVINLSGGGATAPMPRLSAYAASKAAVVRFSETLAEELKEAGVDVNTVAPGALNTRLLDDILMAGPDKAGAERHAKALEQKASGGASLSDAAQLCVALAGAEGDGITGRLISAVWDPWRDLQSLRPKLEGSDIYTLRRIVPKDRGAEF